MALNQLGLGFLFTARDQASAVIHRLERSLTKLNDVQKQQLKTQLVQGAIGMGGLIAGIKIFKASFNVAKEAGEFKRVMQDVKVIAEATDADMAKLHDAAFESKFAGPTESAKALLDLAQAGYGAKDAILMLQPSLDTMAASLGDLSAEQAAALTAQTLKAYGLAAAEADLTTDRLINTANDFALKARELPILIGRSSRGAIAFGNSLEDTLVTVGLARNVVGGIEIAATGASSAMERLINPRFQKGLKKIGVDVADSTTGRFKAFSRVLLEIRESQKFQSMTFPQQEALILKTFGARSSSVVQAFFRQIEAGVQTTTGEMVKGAAAVDYLLGRAKNAQGAKQRFIEAHFGDNLPGQIELLTTAWKKLRVSIGEILEPVLAHLVKRIRQGVSAVFAEWNKLSPETKKFIVQAALAITGLATAFGALIMVKAGIMVLSLILTAMGMSLGALALSLAPFALGIAVVAAGAYLLYKAYRANFGGLADFVDGVWRKVKLAVQGLVQLFSKGEFSGAVMTEIDKVENSGVKSFVIKLWGWAMRIKNFFVGIGSGFKELWPELSFVFGEFLKSLGEIGRMFGVTIGGAEENRSVFQSFGEVGRTVGVVLATTLLLGLRLAAIGVKALTIVVGAARDAWILLGGTTGGVLQTLIGDLQMLFGVLTGNGDLFWRGFVNATIGAVKIVVDVVYGLARALAFVFDMTNKAVGINTNYGGEVQAGRDRLNDGLTDAANYWKGPGSPVVSATGTSPVVASAAGMPAPTVMPSPAQAQQFSSAGLQKAVEQLNATLQGKQAAGGAPGMAHVVVNLGNEQLFSRIERMSRANASQGYMTPAAEAAE
jgi:TP901 family phage tail tape measure protein